MVRWLRWHCPPDTGFEIRALAVWGRARYLSVTEAPHNTNFHTWMGKKQFCFFQTAETGNRTPDAGMLTTTLGPPPWRWANSKHRLRGSGGMPPGIFVLFLATNWCSLVDSGGCRWGKFLVCGGSCDSFDPPPPTGLILRKCVARVNTPPNCVSVFISRPISGLLGIIV